MSSILTSSTMEPDARKPRPALTPEAEQARATRLEREAAALRENLRRRKAQAREREAGTPECP